MRKRLLSQWKGRYYEISSDLFSSFYRWYLITVCAREFLMRGFSLRKEPTFGDAITGFPAKWHLRNGRRNSILMTRYYPDLGSASDCRSSRVGNFIQPIGGTTQIWIVSRHQYGISVLVSQTSFGGSFLRLAWFLVSVKCFCDSENY